MIFFFSSYFSFILPSFARSQETKNRSRCNIRPGRDPGATRRRNNRLPRKRNRKKRTKRRTKARTKARTKTRIKTREARSLESSVGA